MRLHSNSSNMCIIYLMLAGNGSNYAKSLGEERDLWCWTQFILEVPDITSPHFEFISSDPKSQRPRLLPWNWGCHYLNQEPASSKSSQGKKHQARCFTEWSGQNSAQERPTGPGEPHKCKASSQSTILSLSSLISLLTFYAHCHLPNSGFPPL